MKNRVLIIVSKWPNPKTPYLTLLFSEILKRNPTYSLYGLSRDLKYDSLDLISNEAIREFKDRAFYQNEIKWKGLNMLNFILWLLAHLRKFIDLYKQFKNSGLSAVQSIGQIWRHKPILFKSFDLVYFNALQSLKHVNSKILFPDSLILASSRGKDFDFDSLRMKHALNQIDELHVISKYLRDKALDLQFNPDKITLIPPASISPSMPQKDFPLNSSNGTITICTISRFTWEKGLVYALRSVAKLIQSCPEINVKYILIGDGEELDLLKIEAMRLYISNNIVWTGWASQKEIEDHLNKSDIFLLLSISEGFNNSVLQAQAFGLPCIVSNAGGLPENVIHEKTGIVVDKYAVENAGKALVELTRNSSVRMEYSKNAIEHVNSTFSLEKQIDQYDNWFQGALKKDRS